MKTTKIIEGNELIAEFMGWNEGGTDGMYDFPDDFPSYLVDEYHEIPPEIMGFDSNWDWLMPVVGKITSLNEEPEEIDNLRSALLCNDIRTAWSEVVDLIKLHNDNNNKN